MLLIMMLAVTLNIILLYNITKTLSSVNLRFFKAACFG